MAMSSRHARERGHLGLFLVLVITCRGDWRVFLTAVAVSFVCRRRWFSATLEIYQQRRRSVEVRVYLGLPPQANYVSPRPGLRATRLSGRSAVIERSRMILLGPTSLRPIHPPDQTGRHKLEVHPPWFEVCLHRS